MVIVETLRKSQKPEPKVAVDAYAVSALVSFSVMLDIGVDNCPFFPDRRYR